MEKISVEKITENNFKVTVQSSRTTVHEVSLSDAYYNKLCGGGIPKSELIEHAFAFLLEHEPNTSILGTFDLPLINRYFPQFENEMSRKFRAK